MVDYFVAETTKRQPAEPIAATQYFPSVIKLQCELTLEQAAILYAALKQYRAMLQFNIEAIASTPEEKQDAKHDIFVVDRLKGMFE